MDPDSPSLSLQETCSRSKSKNEMDEKNPQDWSHTRKTLLFIALMSSSLLADGYVYLRFAFVFADLISPRSIILHDMTD